MARVKTFLKWFGLFWVASIPGKIVAVAVFSWLTQDGGNPDAENLARLVGFAVQLSVFGLFIWGSRRSWRSRPGAAYTGDDFMHPEVW